jgi:hypothetical protein
LAFPGGSEVHRDTPEHLTPLAASGAVFSRQFGENLKSRRKNNKFVQ